MIKFIYVLTILLISALFSIVYGQAETSLIKTAGTVLLEKNEVFVDR